MYLLTLKKGETESLEDFLARFDWERLSVDDQDECSSDSLPRWVWPRSFFMADLA